MSTPSNAPASAYPHRSAAFRLQKHGIELQHQQIPTPASSGALLQPEGCAPMPRRHPKTRLADSPKVRTRKMSAAASTYRIAAIPCRRKDAGNGTSEYWQQRSTRGRQLQPGAAAVRDRANAPPASNESPSPAGGAARPPGPSDNAGAPWQVGAVAAHTDCPTPGGPASRSGKRSRFSPAH